MTALEESLASKLPQEICPPGTSLAVKQWSETPLAEL